VVGGNSSTTTTSNSTTTTTTTTTTVVIDSNNTLIANCLNQNNGVCTQCNQNYLVVSGKCQLAVKNCSAYNLLTGVCITCDNGLTLQNQQCVQSQITQNISNCQVIDPNNASNCLICVYGYFPKGSSCVAVSSLCDGFNVQTGACFGCLYGLSLQNGACIDNNCLSFNANNSCKQCSTSYQANQNGVCQYSDPNCL